MDDLRKLLYIEKAVTMLDNGLNNDGTLTAKRYDVRERLAELWDAGHSHGLDDAEKKLAEALAGLTRANDAVAQVKRERDAVLEELAQYLYKEANRGIMMMGYHPPTAHQDPKLSKRLGAKRCSKCKDNLKFWGQLTPEAKKNMMGRVLRTAMNARVAAEAQAANFKLVEAADLNASQQVPAVEDNKQENKDGD